MTAALIVGSCVLWGGAGALWGFVARQAWETRRTARLVSVEPLEVEGDA